MCRKDSSVFVFYIMAIIAFWQDTFLSCDCLSSDMHWFLFVYSYIIISAFNLVVQYKRNVTQP